jgi:phospholipid transport system substrate-binding protein
VVGAVTVAVACLLAGAAPAGSSPSPTTVVRSLVEEVRAVLDDPALQGPEQVEARDGKIRGRIAVHFALGAMAAEALGEHLAVRTETERQEFTQLFGDLFTRAYTRLVVSFLAEALIEYGAEEIRDGAASVQTEVVNRRGERLPVAYRLAQSEGRWGLRDVVIDGVSIVENYRVQFQKIIAASSYENLVKRLRTKREEVRAGSPPPR